MAAKTKKSAATTEIAKPTKKADSADWLSRMALNPAFWAAHSIEKFGGFSGELLGKMVGRTGEPGKGRTGW